MKNCFNCKFAVEDHSYKGQVRCAKAEELFGGKRLVEAKEVATCGTWESLVDELIETDFKVATPVEDMVVSLKVSCSVCNGKGVVIAKLLSGTKSVTCHKCNGGGMA
jgi:hypothetical protein